MGAGLQAGFELLKKSDLIRKFMEDVEEQDKVNFAARLIESDAVWCKVTMLSRSLCRIFCRTWQACRPADRRQ